MKSKPLFGSEICSLECSCRMVQPPLEMGLHQFIQCPLHASARKLLKAAKAMLEAYSTGNSMQHTARIALADTITQAEGK